MVWTFFLPPAARCITTGTAVLHPILRAVFEERAILRKTRSEFGQSQLVGAYFTSSNATKFTEKVQSTDTVSYGMRALNVLFTY